MSKTCGKNTAKREREREKRERGGAARGGVGFRAWGRNRTIVVDATSSSS